jgi:conjugal transfer pilus assembly protein TraD
MNTNPKSNYFIGVHMKKEQSDSESSSASLSFLYLVLALFAASKVYPYILALATALDRIYVHYCYAIIPSVKLAFFFSLVLGAAWLWNLFVARQSRKAITGKGPESFFIGHDLRTKEKVYLRESLLATHAQALAPTGEGKTTLLMQLILQGIARGRGLMLVDGKSDRSTIEQLYAHAVKAGRQSDFMVFSLCRPESSSTFNPFCEGTPEQIAERIFGALTLDHSYYGSLQFAGLRSVIALLMLRGERPTPGVIRELLRDQTRLKEWTAGLPPSALLNEILALCDQKADKFQENYSGLVTALGHFSEGATAKLYNSRYPEINLMDAIRRNKIIYFQLPTMLFPYLGAATGKLVLQSLQSAISQIQDSGLLPKNLFPVILDDFNDYIYTGFASLLNKSRSANVGIIFSHQSLGDLDKVGPDFKDVVLNNTRIKFLLRLTDPETAEYFSKMIGTKKTEKSTMRRTRGFFWSQNTGDESVRDTEEYLIHPNYFKSEISRGQSVIVIPHPTGRIIKTVEIAPAEILPELSIPMRRLPEPDILKDSTFGGIEVKTMRRTETQTQSDSPKEPQPPKNPI